MSDRKEFEDWFFSQSNSMSMLDIDVAWDAWQASGILALQKNNFSHERVPMTHKQAIEMNDAAFDKYMTQDARAIELVRSVEAHHGIKPKEQA